ncbi:hypothetical protein G7085_04180 [Tessaracoccus sp. HDW20]|uniref:hypothetical protein n=1 Tax=Tessaracoccus coleopterorum TaxID=2714950 RepID=UPI0018D4367B|nr:hypothetical protein [Tessaracoccus coleopterorum]NHB84109.1 hypothetical protein [Tessaracoccus coleopterorum]
MASALVVGIMILSFNTVAIAMALPMGAAVWGGLWALLRKRRPLRLRTAGDLHLDGSNLVDYALARRRGNDLR